MPRPWPSCVVRPMTRAQPASSSWLMQRKPSWPWPKSLPCRAWKQRDQSAHSVLRAVQGSLYNNLWHTVQGAPRQAAPCRHGRQRGAAVDFEGDWYDEGGVWVGEITPSEILFADGESRPWRLKDRQLHCGRLKVHPGLLQEFWQWRGQPLRVS
ncbi:unnamed protein product [Durusdinium trenchii]|uniref:Uncharacterized protein n=1 Tax=Durusdinium trenchii TaxID=1381693 RepID=A0ABP0IFH7_9DINO